MHSESKKLAHELAKQVQAIIADMPDSVPVKEFHQARYEVLKQTNTRVEFEFPSGTTLCLWLNQKDAE